MVEVIRTSMEDRSAFPVGAQGAPLIHIHLVERHIFGNSTVVKIWGQVKIAAKEIIFARELKLNTLQVLLLTVESGYHYPFIPQKWVYHKGEFDNYASVDILAPSAAYQYEAATSHASAARPSTLPHDGSIWLNFIALGE
ncbi:unnamed protein product [marine sediment metagenome]|uniref:Uncharacterized protein n=1 Tax=marine sediment metagenome TaxID=412755 RepID=X0ZA35_9ZZZZ